MINILLSVIIIILVLSISFDVIEGFRCRGGRRGGGRRRGDRRRYHRWVRGPSTELYDIPNSYYWGGWRPMPPPTIYDYYPSWAFVNRCRSGCGYMGNGVVGCVNPTNRPDSCIFASDCYGC